jgi:hypothetical protein
MENATINWKEFVYFCSFKNEMCTDLKALPLGVREVLIAFPLFSTVYGLDI